MFTTTVHDTSRRATNERQIVTTHDREQDVMRRALCRQDRQIAIEDD